MSDNTKDPYVDWSKAPEGTTQVYMADLKEDGTPDTNCDWEKLEDGNIYEWRVGEWQYYIRESQSTHNRIKRPLNTEPTKQTFAVGVGDDEDLKKALDVIVAKYQGKLVVRKDYEHRTVTLCTIRGHQEDFKDYVDYLVQASDHGCYFDIVDRDEQRKREIQEQIDKLKEELDGL